MQTILPDLLDKHLRIVFCGTAPSPRSAQMQSYYAHPSNLFWSTLYAAQFIPKAISATHYPEILQYGYGLTDLNKQQSGLDVDLNIDCFDAEGLRQKIMQYQPQILAFTSKQGASQFLQQKKLNYGAHTAKIGQTRLWILPSTSGTARPHWLKLKHHWYDLAATL